MDEAEFGIRNARGEWTPDRRASYGPLFARPTRPVAILRWLVTNYLVRWNVLFLLLAVAVYLVATPSAVTAKDLEPGWIGLVLVRNLAIVVAWFGLFHWYLYLRRGQGTRFKYNARWPRESDRFRFGSQTRENMFWTLASGVPIATAYEVVTLWLFANGHVGSLAWGAHPIWFVVLLVLTPLWREVHFYWVHRAIHAPRIYPVVHALHHRNTNPGPWSGLSMHPLEHVAYYSAVLFHWVVPSHPLHALYTLCHLTMAPVPGHTGFEKIELGDERAIDTGCLNHYLHHKYFEVNYSDGAIPFDRWFGSFHDGSPEAHAAMKARLAARNVNVTVAD